MSGEALMRKTAYAAALRNLINLQILELSKAGYQGSADRLEDALDRADALDGVGPYVKPTPR